MRGVLTIFGLLLIGFGLLVLNHPPVLTYVVAFGLICMGAVVIGAAWSARSGQVTYRRIDGVFRGPSE